MYDRYTDRARKVMQLANQEAQQMNHPHVATPHMLLGLVKEGNGVAGRVLKAFGVTVENVRREIEKQMPPGPDTVIMGRLLCGPRANKVAEFAIEEAKQLNHNYVGTEHVLLGLIRDKEAVTYQVLTTLGVNTDELREAVLELLQPEKTENSMQQATVTANEMRLVAKTLTDNTLTKLECFTMAAMEGLLAGTNDMSGFKKEEWPNIVAQAALTYAKATLKALEQE